MIILTDKSIEKHSLAEFPPLSEAGGSIVAVSRP